MKSAEPLGIIAGGGVLPLYIAEYYQNNFPHVPLSIVCIDGEAEPNLFCEFNSISLKIGEVGRACEYFKESNISRIVFAGSVRRPRWKNIKTDSLGKKLLFEILSKKILGDDKLLRIVSDFFIRLGFEIVSPAEILETIFTSSAEIVVLTKATPSDSDNKDIDLGIHVSRELGKLDIGQSVVVSEGRIIGVEAAEGTNELIKRCHTYLDNKDGKAGILVKTMKPQQDPNLDIPTIGKDTISLLSSCNYKGVAFDKLLILDKETCVKEANEKEVFILCTSS